MKAVSKWFAKSNQLPGLMEMPNQEKQYNSHTGPHAQTKASRTRQERCHMLLRPWHLSLFGQPPLLS